MISLFWNANKKEKIIIVLFIGIFLCILPSAFLYEKCSRVLFYLDGYIASIGLFIAIRKKSKLPKVKWQLMSFMIIGITFISWSFYASLFPHNNSELLFTPGKRFIFGVVIIYYILYIYQNYEETKTIIKKLACISIVASFMAASIYGFFQGIHSTDRILLGINRPTMSAYAYSALSIALLSIIMKNKNLIIKDYIFLATCMVSFYIIYLTQTRSAIVINTLLIIFLAYKNYFSSKKTIVLLIISAFLICSAFSYKILHNRFESTLNEINKYQNGDDHTSLGSRFTMWESGIAAFKHAPFGQTAQERNGFIEKHLATSNNPNSEAINYLNVHLHNEIIQYASLFGTLGIISLLFFYFINIIPLSKTGIFSIITISTLLYGSTDVLLTSIEYVVILTILFANIKIIEGK
ncbi:O-antigen ligase family protein [Klebsiella pneumoniae]|uniref:O-antigen ligase family protein n=1 Tax=Klebsiella pneumoniae TaxID=573 RepID=UPI003F57A1E6